MSVQNEVVDQRPAVLDVCAGIGGWSIALAVRGYQDLPVENAPHPRAALEANGIEPWYDDLVRLLRNPFIGISGATRDLAGAVGSTPCQPFSQANRNALGVLDPRGDLTLTYLALVEKIHPPFVCLENVSRGTGPVFDEIAVSLRALGYEADHRVVNAADHGLPQARKRRLLAARRDGLPVSWPAPTHVDTRAAAGKADVRHGIRLPWITLAEALPDRDDLPDWAHRHPATTIVGSFRPECVAPPTYRKPGDGPRQNQPGTVVLSLEERLMIQGFPVDWQTSGPATARGLQVGNAIPPMLAEVALSAALD